MTGVVVSGKSWCLRPAWENSRLRKRRRNVTAPDLCSKDNVAEHDANKKHSNICTVHVVGDVK